MNYWFDITDLINRKDKHYTGVQRVVAEPILELAKNHPNIKAFYFNSETFKFYEAKINPSPTSNKLFRKTSCEIAIQKTDKLILLGATWGYRPMVDGLIEIIQSSNCKLYSFIHDITAIKVPQYHLPVFPPIFENWFKDLIIPFSHKIITNSEYSKNDVKLLYKEYDAVPPQITTVRLGDELKTVQNTKMPELIKEDENFLLCVSTIEPRKNHQLLYNTWNLMLERFSNKHDIPKIYLIGGKGWNNENLYFQMTTNPELNNKIVHLQNINDEELRWLYQNCLFTLYPAKYEGWGLPVAESLANGKMCIASNRTSIPEIGEDLVDYISPYSTEDCYNKIIHALENRDYIKSRENEIKENYKVTSWSMTANEILNIIQ